MGGIDHITAIIVEDEVLAKESLIAMLNQHHSNIHIIAEYPNYDIAFPEIVSQNPDLLFLNIQLDSKKTAFAFFGGLSEEEKENSPYTIYMAQPWVREYILNAIKSSITDFLLKPIVPEELNRAIEKAKQSLLAARSKHDEIYSFRVDDSVLHLSSSEIIYCTPQGNATHFILSDEREVLVPERFSGVDSRLNKSLFLRVDRCHIVNMSYVFKLDFRNNLCITRTHSGKQYELGISIPGMKLLKARVK